ncbi:hypothetical protein HDV03_004119 [Kappamyces sp. JEL0829]|nr:hypothetical protein HDV03_004119 [Kappamyces sp. JEL0829]
MTDSVSHSFDDCIFSTTQKQLIVDPQTCRILYSSNEAAQVLLFHQTESAANFESSPGAQALVGRSLDEFFTSPRTVLECVGKIQPTEIYCSADSEASKWIYSCAHVIPQPTGGSRCVVLLQEVSELKQEFNELTRNPLPLESIHKMASTEVPDFVSDNKYSIGEMVSLRIDKQGRVQQLYPFNETYLGTPRSKIHNQVIMQLIHTHDHIILTRSLAECLKQGSFHFVVRWNPLARDGSPELPCHWVQAKAVRSTDNTILLTLSQLQEKLVQQTSLADQAWSLFSAPISAAPLSSLISVPIDAGREAFMKSLSFFSASTPSVVPDPPKAASQGAELKILKSDALDE